MTALMTALMSADVLVPVQRSMRYSNDDCADSDTPAGTMFAAEAIDLHHGYFS
jgi:hypothetical protein